GPAPPRRPLPALRRDEHLGRLRHEPPRPAAAAGGVRAPRRLAGLIGDPGDPHMKSIFGTADLNGATFHFEMAGIGPPVVFIHAGIADSRMWEGQFAPLSKWFRVIRYDLRGFGRTLPAPGPFSHRDDLAALLDHLAIERASLVGCSI